MLIFPSLPVHYTNILSKHSSFHSSAAECSGQSFASILSNMSLTKQYSGSKRTLSRTLLSNSKFLLNQRDVRYSAKEECTNWGLPPTTLITTHVFSFPASTFPKMVVFLPFFQKTFFQTFVALQDDVVCDVDPFASAR